MDDLEDIRQRVLTAAKNWPPAKRRAAEEFSEKLMLPDDRLDRRDALLRKLRCDFHVAKTDHAAAHHIASVLRSYAGNGWKRERSDDVCPRRHIGLEKELLWQIMKIVPKVLSAERIRKIVGHEDRLK